MLCQHKFVQYARKPSVNPRGLGRWCSWRFYCNPTHVTRLVVAYQPCARKAKGLKMVYQQHMQYIQTRGLQTDPVALLNSDLSKHIQEWRRTGERIVLVINVNGHPLHNNLYRQQQERRTEMEEFSHKCWDPKSPTYSPSRQISYRWSIQIPGGGDHQLMHADWAIIEAFALTSPHAPFLANSDIKYASR